MRLGGLRVKRRGERTVGKGIQGGDCGKGDPVRGLWKRGSGEGTVGKGIRVGDCEERDAGRGL